MIAQIALTAGVCLAFFYTFIQKTTRSGFRYFLYGVLVLGLYFIWAPDQATAFAHVIGVGRGADLVTYFWIVFSLIVIVILHLKIRLLHEQLTELARSVAIQNSTSKNNERY